MLIHGAGGTQLYWPSQVRRLPGYRVYAPDLPGHGKSEKIGQQSIEGYADAVLEWLEAVGIHRVVLVGHSMGSAIAMWLAIYRPEQVMGLGLVGAGARLRVAPLLLENAASQTTFLTAVQLSVAWSFSPQAPESLVEIAAKRMAEVRPSVFYGDLLACDGFDVMERVCEIQAPTLIVCGEDDRMTPSRYAHFLANNIPKAILKTIPEAGHMVMLEKPDEVASTLTEFLAGVTY